MFSLQTKEVKLCVKISFRVQCNDLELCDNDTSNHTGCYNHTLIWTSINLSSLSGSFLFEYAALNWEFLGFEWGRACDLGTAGTLHLVIQVPTLVQLCDTKQGKKCIDKSLERLTTMVSV